MHFHHNTHTDIFITVEFQYRLHLKAFRTLGREGGKGVIRQADIRLILRGVRALVISGSMTVIGCLLICLMHLLLIEV